MVGLDSSMTSHSKKNLCGGGGRGTRLRCRREFRLLILVVSFVDFDLFIFCFIFYPSLRHFLFYLHLNRPNTPSFPTGLIPQTHTHTHTGKKFKMTTTTTTTTETPTVALTDDNVDDILYLGRADEVADLTSTVAEIATGQGVSPHAVLVGAVDSASGNTVAHYAAANGHRGLSFFFELGERERRAWNMGGMLGVLDCLANLL